MYRNLLFFCVILCSILACEKAESKKEYIEITTAAGPEDIVLDEANSRILVSCDERRPGQPEHGAIWQIRLSDDVSTALPVAGLPEMPFHPHGFDLRRVGDVDYLYVINHYKDEAYTNSVLQLRVEAEQLVFVREFKHPLLISPNDLFVLENGAFYFTNDKNSGNLLDLLTNPSAGSVVYCDGDDNWKKVDSALAFPNGLYAEGNTLFLSTSRNQALFTYDMQPDGSLRNRKVLSTINGMDNLTSYKDELVVSVHPNELQFALLSYLPATLSPSKSFAINKKTGRYTPLFSDDGSRISGASTTIIHGKDLYLAQVFGEYVLKVKNFQGY